MKHNIFLKPAIYILLVLAIPSAYAQMPPPFSADMTSTMADGQKMTGKWFFSAPKMRMDVTSMPQVQGSPFGGQMSWIVDGATQTSYMLMPQQQMYMEFQGNGMHDQGMKNLATLARGGDPCSGRTDVTCKKTGTETVNGRVCDRWETVDKDSKKSIAWVDQKLHFPIKVQNQEGNITEFTNIKEGAQDSSLFKVPAGYRKFDAGAVTKQSH